MRSIAVSIEGWFGLGWPQWRRLAEAVPRLGFSGMFLSDHLQIGAVGSAPQPALELIVALSYLASHTERIHFGAMVSPLSVRDPVLLARQSMALDDLSGGRMIIGVGAGWSEGEHTMFGYPLGDMATRMERFAEGLEVIVRLTRSEGPASFDGRFFQLRDAQLMPRSPRPGGPPIMVGGGGPRRTLPLVARYADRWDATGLQPEPYRERAAQLDALLAQAGRRPRDVLRSVTVPVICGRGEAELERRLAGVRRWAAMGALPTAELVGALRAGNAAICGEPAEVAAQIRAYAAAGVDELVVQWFNADDIEGLAQIMAEVAPLLS